MKQWLSFALLLITTLLTAQSYQVQGTVLDQKGEPQEFVNVFLVKDTTVMAGDITDEQGNFSIKAPSDEYRLKASHLYLGQKEMPLSLTGDQAGISLVLEEKSVELSEVVVTDFRNESQAGIDKRVIYVSDELKKINTNLSELLEMVSLVNMDMEGNPTIPGKEGVVVLVDGRPPRMRAENLATVLRLIPSDQILRIEVMTNPPAKYTKSNSAVINVVTNRKPQSGSLFNGWTSTSTQGGLGVGGSFTWKKNNWSMSSWGGRWNWLSRSKNTETRLNLNESDFYRIEQEAEGKHNGYGTYFGIAPEYKFNEKNIFSMNTGFFSWNNDHTNENDVRIYNIDGNLNQLLPQSEDASWNGLGGYLGAEYFRYFDEKEKELTMALEVKPNVRDNRSEEVIQGDSPFYQLTEGEERNWRIEGEFEFFDPIDSMSSLNYAAEYEYIFPYDSYLNLNTGSNENEASKNEDLSYHNTIEKMVQESSVSYARQFSKFGINLDLGQQWTRYDILFDQTEKVERDYFFIIPKTTVNFKFIKGLDFGISYKFAQEAPDIYVLNPNIRVSGDRLTRWFGNPDLDAIQSHNFQLSSGFYLGKFNVGFTGFYRTSNNAISRFSRVNNEGIRERTYENNGDFTRTGMDLSLSGSFKKWGKIDLTASLFDSRINQSIGTNPQTLSYSGNVQMSVFLPKKWSLRFSTQYNGPTLDIQGVNRSYYIVRASIRKSFLQGKLNASLNFSDIARSAIRGGTYSDPAFEIEDRDQRLRPYASLRISYRWGELKEMPKSTKAGQQQ